MKSAILCNKPLFPPSLASKKAGKIPFSVEPHEMVKELKRMAEIELKSRAFTG